MTPIARLLAILCLCLLPHAVAADPVSEAETALAAGRPAEARRLLAQAPAATAAERARRDLVLANIAFLEGDHAGAIRRYDALISQDPNEPVYRLALSRALLAVGQRDRAQYHLFQLRGSDRLAPDERARLDRVLTSLEGGRRREGWLRFAIVPESNPGQRTDATNVTLGDWLGNITVPLTGGRARPETGLHFGIGGALLPVLGPGLRLRLGLDLDARVFRTSALNDLTFGSRIGLQGLGRGGAGWDLALSARERRVGNRAYGRAIGLHAGWTQRVGSAAQLQLRLDLENWRHATAVDQDGARQSLSLGWTQALRPDLAVRATLFAHHNNARAADASGRGFGASVGVQRVFAGGLMLSLDLTHQRSRRDAPDWLFGVLRQDRRTTVTARVLHRGIALRGFAPALEVGFDRQKSTLALHDFRNARVSVAFSREF